MRRFTQKNTAVHILLFVGILFVSQSLLVTEVFAAPRRSRTWNTEYQSNDSGRYRNSNNNALWNQISTLSSQPVVANVRIPVLIGVKVSDLEDTWGDARSNGRTHEGIDILAPRGTLVVSPTDAIVTTVEDSGNGGKHVFTANPGGERFYYAHLDSYATGIAEGQTLKAGDLIGYVGNTGNASAGPTHLHFGIYHDDRVALNPFPRLTLEFSLQERIDVITKVLNASTDQQNLARLLVGQYRSIFIEAQNSRIILPQSITLALSDTTLRAAVSITRTLKLGMSGDDVKELQASLGITADGSFGPKTKAAVIAFQTSHNLAADGVFGPASRSAMGGNTGTLPAGCTSTVGYSGLTGIKCTTIIYR